MVISTSSGECGPAVNWVIRAAAGWIPCVPAREVGGRGGGGAHAAAIGAFPPLAMAAAAPPPAVPSPSPPAASGGASPASSYPYSTSSSSPPNRALRMWFWVGGFEVGWAAWRGMAEHAAGRPAWAGMGQQACVAAALLGPQGGSRGLSSGTTAARHPPPRPVIQVWHAAAGGALSVYCGEPCI